MDYLKKQNPSRVTKEILLKGIVFWYVSALNHFDSILRLLPKQVYTDSHTLYILR